MPVSQFQEGKRSVPAPGNSHRWPQPPGLAPRGPRRVAGASCALAHARPGLCLQEPRGQGSPAAGWGWGWGWATRGLYGPVQLRGLRCEPRGFPARNPAWLRPTSTPPAAGAGGQGNSGDCKGNVRNSRFPVTCAAGEPVPGQPAPGGAHGGAPDAQSIPTSVSAPGGAGRARGGGGGAAPDTAGPPGSRTGGIARGGGSSGVRAPPEGGREQRGGGSGLSP